MTVTNETEYIGVNGVLLTASSAETLSSDEHEALVGVLRILRMPQMGYSTLQQTILKRLLDSLAHDDKTNIAHMVCDGIMEYFVKRGDADTIEGFIVGGNELVFLEEESHVKAALATTSRAHRESWFSSWLAVWFTVMADKNPNPTPIEVARSLVNDIDQFDIDIAVTKRMLSRYPGMFKPESERTPAGA